MVTDTDQTFVQILQKHCGGRLFLAGILLYAVGNVFAGHRVFNIWDISILLFRVLSTAGLFLVYFESRRQREPKNTLRVLIFFIVSTIVVLAVLLVLAWNLLQIVRNSGNWGAFIGFYGLMLTVPRIVSLALFLWAIIELRRGIKKNVMRKLRSVLPLSIFVIINMVIEPALLGLLNTGHSAAFRFWFFGLMLISAAGTLVFIVALNRFNREVKNAEKVRKQEQPPENQTAVV